MFILIRSLVVGTVKGIAVLALAGAILWEVAEHSGSQKGIVYIHVSKPQVLVTVDAATHWVETLWETPIVCELRPGRHMLRMIQGGRVLFEQEFQLEPGQERVLTAWEEPDPEESAVESEMSSVDPLLSPSHLARRYPREP